MESGEPKAGRRPYRMRARAQTVAATADGILDAAIELFSEEPYEDVSLERVGERAGVTRRTVIRRFGSKEGLFVASMERAGEEMTRQRDEASADDVAGAVRNVVEHYEAWGTNRLRMIAQEGRIAVVREHVEFGRRYHRAWVERTFAPLLRGKRGNRRERLITGLLVLTDVYTWKLLRLDLGLSRAETERTLVDLISELKGGP